MNRYLFIEPFYLGTVLIHVKNEQKNFLPINFGHSPILYYNTAKSVLFSHQKKQRTKKEKSGDASCMAQN
jgi:hypothetical protein